MVVAVEEAVIRHHPLLGLIFCLALQTHRAARGWVSIPVEMGLEIVAVAVAAEAEAMKVPTVLVVGVDSGALQLRSKPGLVGEGWYVPCQLSPVAEITYSTPCAVDSRLLTPWWGMVESESTTDRDVFSLLPPSSHLI